MVCRIEQEENRVRLERKGLLISAAILLLTSILGSTRDIAVEAAASFFWGALLATAYSDWQIKKAYHFSFFIAAYRIYRKD